MSIREDALFDLQDGLYQPFLSLSHVDMFLSSGGTTAGPISPLDSLGLFSSSESLLDCGDSELWESESESSESEGCTSRNFRPTTAAPPVFSSLKLIFLT